MHEKLEAKEENMDDFVNFDKDYSEEKSHEAEIVEIRNLDEQIKWFFLFEMN